MAPVAPFVYNDDLFAENISSMVHPISSAEFRDSLASFASGVTIVTAHLSGQPIGFTATAFTSVSLDPPLILVCVGKQGRAHQALQVAGSFGVNVLNDSQGWIAGQFARPGVDRFRGVALRDTDSPAPPLIADALVQLVCDADRRIDVGDHTIVIGAVKESTIAAGRPLIHFARQLGGFVVGPPQESGGTAAATDVTLDELRGPRDR